MMLTLIKKNNKEDNIMKYLIKIQINGMEKEDEKVKQRKQKKKIKEMK